MPALFVFTGAVTAVGRQLLRFERAIVQVDLTAQALHLVDEVIVLSRIDFEQDVGNKPATGACGGANSTIRLSIDAMFLEKRCHSQSLCAVAKRFSGSGPLRHRKGFGSAIDTTSTFMPSPLAQNLQRRAE